MNNLTAEFRFPVLDDWHTHEARADEIRELLEAFVTDLYGDRCDVAFEGCPTCDQWAMLDALLENPHDPPESEDSMPES